MGPIDVLARCLPGLKGRVLILVDEEFLPAIARLDTAGVGIIYLAVKEPRRMAASLGEFPPERLLDRSKPDFIDRVKVITGGKGFENVLVLSREPETVKTALGVSAVLGDIHLLVPPSGKVAVDLTATINFKSLKIHGYGH